MEHRWGRRVEVDVPLHIRGQDGQVHPGLLRDLSASGAFVETCTPPRPFTAIEVEFDVGESAPSSLSAAACVVRHGVAGIGIGIEWLEFNPAPVAVLLGRPVHRVWADTRSHAAA